MQYAHRHQGSVANSDSGTGPAVSITGIASFGGPTSGTGQGNAGFDFKQNITQVIDNFTYIRAAHSYKFGIDMQRIHDERIAAPQFLYTFPSIAAYQAAKAGTNRLGYSSMTQITGDLNFAMDTSLYSTVRPGRLADRAEGEGALRRPLRPLPVPDRAGDGAAHVDAELQHRQEQLRTARRRGLVA